MSYDSSKNELRVPSKNHAIQVNNSHEDDTQERLRQVQG